MDQEITGLIVEIVSKSSLIFLALVLGYHLLKSGLTSYLGQKAINLATREDFAQLLDQQKKTTQEVEAIRSDITHGTWLKQQRWEARRERYGTLLSALFQYQSREGVRLKELQLARSGTLGVEDAEFFGKYTRQHIDESIDIHEAIFTAMFVVNKEANLILRKYLEQLLAMSREQPTSDNIESLIEKSQENAANAFAELLKIAEKEFNEDVSIAPTGTPRTN
jgi:hypothetical protein